MRSTLVFLIALTVACSGSKTPPATTAAPEVAAPAPVVEEAPARAPEAAAAAPQTLTVPTDAGDVRITPVYHGTVRIEHGETVLWIDPWSKANLEEAARADVIVITDVHHDHLDRMAIEAVKKDSSVFVAPKAVADDAKMAKHPVAHVLAHGETAEVAGFTIEAVPMYNLERGPREGTVFHAKGRGNGYVFGIGGKRIYVAGDTECTEEMKALEGIDHALLPMNLPYTMTPEEAAGCVEAFRPARVTPIHYAGSDLDAFERALDGVDGVTVDRVNAYPGGLPW